MADQDDPPKGESDNPENWKPVTEATQQLPVGSVLELDKLGLITSTLASHDLGMFTQSARLVDGMLRIGRIRGCLDTRVGGVLSAPLDFQPGNGRAKARKAADLLRGSDTQPALFGRMCPPSALMELGRWQRMLGFALGELVWARETFAGMEMWIPRLRWWHPQFVFWRWDTLSYWLITFSGGLIELPSLTSNVHSDGHWVLFCPDGYEYGWRRGLIGPLGETYLTRRWGRRDLARHSEVLGGAIFKVETPENHNVDAKKALMRKLSNLGSNSVIETPKGSDEASSWGVELMQADAKVYEGILAGLHLDDAEIASLILGQAPAGKEEGLTQGRQQADEKIRNDLAKSDAACWASTIREQILYWWAVHNFGDGDFAPLLDYQVEPPDDESVRNQGRASLATALPALEAAGVDVYALCEDEGLPMVDRAEFEDERDAADEAALVPPDSTAAPIAPGDPSAPVTDEQALAALSSIVAVGRGQAAQGHKYLDKLHAKGRRVFADALAPDLAAVLATIRQGGTFDEIKTRLLHDFKRMDPKRLETLIYRANMLAALAGHDAARK